MAESTPARAADDQPSLAAITAHLVAHPTATMAEIAVAIGSSRSTLHRRYPRRADLLDAIESSALAQVTEVHRRSDVDGWFDDAVRTEEAISAYVGGLIELGPQLMLLARTRPEEPWTRNDVRALDAQLESAMARGQDRGALTPRLSATWLIESLHALVYAAWEQVAHGRLAARDATRSVMTSWWAGAAHHRRR
ncbi:hypothetical protein OVN20_03470 [Microcella daejeonensis]|uniref:TetR/AcrR family transcriptional regulator n=1 Tax=Microcella daejeonensis TaxID=2994971 RepID=UPI002270D92C|nr:hypothetical protein [Microcella daejeonensis]WAB84639.1 hypothetical protein OVN20_03470 [Microcella daejeonensis]